MILINVAQVFSLSLSFFLFSFLLTFYLRLCFMLVSICLVRSWSLFFFSSDAIEEVERRSSLICARVDEITMNFSLVIRMFLRT